MVERLRAKLRLILPRTGGKIKALRLIMRTERQAVILAESEQPERDSKEETVDSSP